VTYGIISAKTAQIANGTQAYRTSSIRITHGQVRSGPRAGGRSISTVNDPANMSSQTNTHP
jgi:hypothetical protein